MDLHRRRKRPDWEYVIDNERNIYQKIAFSTKGVITPANVCTLTGLAMVLYGCWFILEDRILLGTILIGIGRAIDLVDGLVADRSGTKSYVGEAFDSIADKLTALAVFIVFWVAGIMLAWQIIVFLLLQIINSFVTVRSKLINATIHTSPTGKKASFTMWLTVGLYALAFVITPGMFEFTVTVLAHVSFAVSVYLGVIASIGYWLPKK